MISVSILPFLLAFLSGLPAIQTDWSAGAGQPGPVEEWTDFYNQSNHADHTVPGEITVEASGEAGGFLYSQPILENSDEVYALETADLDGNGFMDVVCATFTGEITVCFQESSLSWEANEIDNTGTSISGLDLEDFDGDGYEDIIVCMYDQGELLWYRNPLPGGSIWEVTFICPSDKPRSVIAADMDQDGDPDVICASENEGVFICWNQNGSGSSWTIEPVDSDLLPAGNVAWADMDSDGNPDILATGGEYGGIFLYTSPLWTMYAVDDSIGVVEDITAAELNGDAYTDIVVSALTGYRTRSYQNPGDPSGVWSSALVGNRMAISIAAADIDEDGDTDLVTSNTSENYLNLYLNTGTGAWQHLQFSTGTMGFSDMSVADIDGDMIPDIAGASYFDDMAVWCKGVVQTTYYSSATLTSSVLHCESLSQAFPLFLEAEVDGYSIMRFRASDDPDNMGPWSAQLQNTTEDVSSFIESGDSYCQYLVTLYSQGDFTPSTLYQISLTSNPSGTGHQSPALFALVSPNPACGIAEFRFGLNEPAAVSFSVYDLGGRVVISYEEATYSPGENGIFMHGLSPGLYLARATIAGEPHSLKFVITEGR